MPGFNALLASAQADGNSLSVDLPETWAQGRTAYGGLSAALCVEAARLTQPGLPPLRSAQFAFAGPASGRLSAHASLLRKGRSVALVSVALDGEAGNAAQALLTYGAPRVSTVEHHRLPMPSVPRPDRLTSLTPSDLTPRFMANFDMRPASGGLPLSKADPDIVFWIRHHDAAGADPITALVALADSLPPAAMTQFPKPAPISTVTWSFDVLGTVAADDWCLLRSSSEHAQGGYSAQAMTMWDKTGALLMTGRQVIALFV